MKFWKIGNSDLLSKLRFVSKLRFDSKQQIFIKIGIWSKLRFCQNWDLCENWDFFQTTDFYQNWDLVKIGILSKLGFGQNWDFVKIGIFSKIEILSKLRFFVKIEIVKFPLNTPLYNFTIDDDGIATCNICAEACAECENFDITLQLLHTDPNPDKLPIGYQECCGTQWRRLF